MLEQGVARAGTWRRFSKPAALYLLCVTLVGAVLRVLDHAGRPFMNDEVGTLIYVDKPVAYLLTHFESWLTMNYFIIAEKFIAHIGGRSPISLMLIPMLAGIATIPLTALLARMLASTRVALIAATLAAANPYLLFYSGNIRSYSLLAALCLVVLILFFGWRERPTLRNGIFVALACVLAVLSHLNGAYVGAVLLLVTAVDLLGNLRRAGAARAATLLGPLAVAMVLLGAAYAHLIPAIVAWGVPYHAVPPTSVSYVPYVASQYFGDGYYAWPSLIVLLYGLLLAGRHFRPSWMLAPFLVVPSVLMSVQGISHFPWAFGRFLIFLVPVCLVFMAEGLEAIGTRADRRSYLTPLLVGIVIIAWIPGLVTAFQRRADLPWDRVAGYINSVSAPNDVILYRSGDESLSLYPYFSHATQTQSVVADYSEMQHAAAGGRTVFVVRGEPFVNSQYPTEIFGKLQVIVYPRQSYPVQLMLIRDDVLTSLRAGELSPQITEDYRDVWAIDRKLGQDEHTTFQHYQMYRLCLELTDRQRNLPISLQYLEAQTDLRQDVMDGP